MKHKISHLIVFALITCIMCTILVPAFATDDSDDGPSTRASLYINAARAYVDAGSSTGSLKVYFSITSRGKMSSIGATKIQIYNTSGTCVKTFNANSTNGMLGSDRYSYSNSVTYTGAKSGDYYYAVVTFKASDSSGGDSCTYVTASAAAK